MVSILCLAYNHEKYIRQCLDSLVCQKFDHDYEIIVHDDASTDGTRSIIEEYAEKYPDLIKPIFQTENQYSKGVKMAETLLYPAVAPETKYVAYCECDDYWCDEYKIQKQFNALESNPNCSFCVTKVLKVTEGGESTNEYLPPNDIKGGIIKSREFIRMTCYERYAFQTASYMHPIKYEREMQSVPTFIQICSAGDMVKLWLYGDKGDVFYIDEATACHRLESMGSWTERIAMNEKLYIEHLENMIETAKEYNKYTKGKYNAYCKYYITQRKWMVAHYTEDYREMVKKEYRKYFDELSFRERLFAFLNVYFPHIVMVRNFILKRKK